MLKMIKKYRQLLVGICIGSVLFSALPIGAAIEEYICYKADYKVMINGKEYTDPDLPILNYKGYTYAPFRSILEAAGLNINWNADLGLAEITSPITPSTNTSSISSDIPENFNDAILPEGMEYVWYNNNWCIKYNGNYYMERISGILKLYGAKGIMLAGCGTDEKNNCYYYINTNTKHLSGENTKYGYYDGYYYRGNYIYKVIEIDTSNLNDCIKITNSNNHIYYYFNIQKFEDLINASID